MSNPNGSRLRHGAARKGHTTTEYRIWMRMRGRCNDPGDAAFALYGGRGIKVCQRWETFENFLADMGCRPDPNHSLDRCNNDKGYEPGNCRWATWTEQQRNRRNNRLFTVEGVTASLAEHCDRAGCKYKTAHQRLKMGASIEAALSPERAPYRSLPLRKKDITLGRLLAN